MIVELLRALAPEEIGSGEECEICGEHFSIESVLAFASTDEGSELLGLICPACVGMLGRRKPERFPTLEEYEAAKLRCPAPIWATAEEGDAALERGASPAQRA